MRDGDEGEAKTALRATPWTTRPSPRPLVGGEGGHARTPQLPKKSTRFGDRRSCSSAERVSRSVRMCARSGPCAGQKVPRTRASQSARAAPCGRSE